jgi:N-acetylglucosamine-6-phosphate deacetylase
MQKWAHGRVKFLTIAAEVEGAERLARYAASQGVTVSLGHQMAAAADLKRLAAAGAQALTHLGNGIPHMIPRHVNPIWAGLANDDLMAMLITDSHHLPGDVVRAMVRAKGVDQVVATSDAAHLAGMPPGRYHTGFQDVVLETNGLLHVADTGYLAGSSATLMQCMNFLASLGFLSEAELLQLGFRNPCRLIGLDPRKVRSDYTVALNPRTHRFMIRR